MHVRRGSVTATLIYSVVYATSQQTNVTFIHKMAMKLNCIPAANDVIPGTGMSSDSQPTQATPVHRGPGSSSMSTRRSLSTTAGPSSSHRAGKEPANEDTINDGSEDDAPSYTEQLIMTLHMDDAPPFTQMQDAGDSSQVCELSEYLTYGLNSFYLTYVNICPCYVGTTFPTFTS